MSELLGHTGERINRAPTYSWSGAVKAAVLTALVFSLSTAPALATGRSSAIEKKLNIRKIEQTKSGKITLHLGLTTAERTATFQVLEDGRLAKNLQTYSHVAREPVAVTLLMDVSGSMAGTPLADAKGAAKLFVDRAGNEDRIALVAFSSTVRRLSGFTNDKQKLIAAIDSLAAEGETAVYDGLLAALQSAESSKLGNQSMILLSDGGDTASKSQIGTAADLAERLKVPISAIALQSADFNPGPIESIALRSGGRLMTAFSSASLNDLYDGLAAELHNRYELTFISRRQHGEAKIAIAADLGDQVLRSTISINRGPAPVKSNQAPHLRELAQTTTPWLAIPWLVAILAFAAAVLAVFALDGLIAPGQNHLAEQLKYYDQLHGTYKPEAKRSVVDQTKTSVVDLVSQVSTKMDFTSYAQAKLELAGLPVKPHEYIALHVAAVIISSLAVALWKNSVLWGLTTTILAAAGPLLALELAIERRLAAFEEQLPDTLDLIAGSMRAGFGLQQAIVNAAREARQPIAGELLRVANQTQMGMPLDEALQRLAVRINSTAFKWVVLAMTIHRETGGNLAEILDNLSASLRQRETMRRQVKALTAEGRMSAIILILLPFAEVLLLFSVNPRYMMPLLTTAVGLAMLLAAIGLMIIGGLWLRKVTNIEY